MKLTKTSAQAALAMGYLADCCNDRPTQARQVAEHLGVPTDSALKILQALARQRLLRSQLGRSGGYQMLTPADDITLLQVVEAIDGPISAELPLQATDEELVRPLATLRDVCMRSAQHLRNELANTTIADLARSCHTTTPDILSASFAAAG